MSKAVRVLLTFIVLVNYNSASEWLDCIDHRGDLDAPESHRIMEVMTGECFEIVCDEKNNIEWTKDGHQIFELASGEIKNQGWMLYAHRARKPHAGNYKCSPNSTNSFQIVVSDAMYMNGPWKAVEGQNVTIECLNIQKGDKIQWTKYLMPLNLTSRRIHVNTSDDHRRSTLYIEGIQIRDGGSYRCLENTSTLFSLSIFTNNGCFGTKTVKVGEPWSIECTNNYHGSVWSRNGNEIDKKTFESEGLAEISTSRSIILHSEHASLLHSGYYSNIGIYDGKWMWVYMNDQIYYHGEAEVFEGDEEASIRCIGFNTVDDVSWRKDGKWIDALSFGEMSVSTEKGISEIKISNVLERHQGNYSCARSSNESFSLTVKKGGYIGPLVVWEGEGWRIRCKVAGSTTVLDWMINDQWFDFHQQHRMGISSSWRSDLYSRKATKEHENHYKCTPGFNEAFYLSVTEKNSYFGRHRVWEGEPWSIECKQITLGLNVSWKKNGTPIENLLESDGIKVMNTSYQTSKIYSHRAVKAHQGKYSCSPGPNGTLELSVLDKDVYNVGRGETSFIECGRTNPGVIRNWTKDGHPIDELLKHETFEIIQSIDGYSKLYLYNVSKEHEGHYKCIPEPNGSFFLEVHNFANSIYTPQHGLIVFAYIIALFLF